MFDELILSINSNIKAQETDSQKICLRASFKSNRAQGASEAAGQRCGIAAGLESVSARTRPVRGAHLGLRLGRGRRARAGRRGRAGGREIINNRRLFQAEAHIKVGAPQGPCSSLRLGQRYIPGANKVI